MPESGDYGKRADELSDSMRRYLIGINTGGIAVTLTFAANMAEKGVHPDWAIWPAGLFAFGLGVSGASLLYAKHKALKRKEAVEQDKEVPRYDAWCQRNFTYELITLLIFMAAAVVALYRLHGFDFQAGKNCRGEVALLSSRPNPALSPTPESEPRLHAAAAPRGS